MKRLSHGTLVAFSLAAVLTACGDDDGTGPDETPASIEGTVEETTPGPATSTAPAAAPGTDAESVTAVTIGADGSLTEVAETAPEVDATYVLDSVPAGLADLAVVAYVGDRDAGRVLIHGSTTAGTILEAAPINYETTVEAPTSADRAAPFISDASAASLAHTLMRMRR